MNQKPYHVGTKIRLVSSGATGTVSAIESNTSQHGPVYTITFDLPVWDEWWETYAGGQVVKHGQIRPVVPPILD